MHSEDRDPFAEIVGRALIEPGYRDQLIVGSEAVKLATLVDAGLTEAEAQAVLPFLDGAVEALNEFANHDAFGERISAA